MSESLLIIPKCAKRIKEVKMASADLSISPTIDSEGAMSAGEFVLKKLLAEFVAISERKLQDIASQSSVSSSIACLSADHLCVRAVSVSVFSGWAILV